MKINWEKVAKLQPSDLPSAGGDTVVVPPELWEAALGGDERVPKWLRDAVAEQTQDFDPNVPLFD